MEWNRIEGDWRHYKSGFKRQWRKLTNIDVITGERQRLALHIQDRYDISKEEAEMQLANWQGRQRGIDCPA